MRKADVVRARSFQRAGRLVPRRARGLRACAVLLKPRQVMDWHSTRTREELLIALTGQLHLEVQHPAGRIERRTLRAGHCVFLPRQTVHRLVNCSSATARYLYVTAPGP